jgi:predicted HAD superfamily Cof-like phosphohydrolase
MASRTQTVSHVENNEPDLSTTHTMSHFQLVGEFHDTFRHPRRKELYRNCFESEPNLVPFRISLMREELTEFKTAFLKDDLVEMADALCDLSYVTNGAGQCLGIDLDRLRNEMHLDIESEGTYHVDLDILKKDPSIVDNGLKELERTLNDFCVYADNQDLGVMAEALARILKKTYDLGHALGFNMDAMFREVHRSNMTKVCSNIEDALASIDFYSKEGRYKNPSMTTKGKYYVVSDADTTKILKSRKWEQPNLKQFF